MKDYLLRFKGTIAALLIFLILLATVLVFDREKEIDVEAEKVFPHLTSEVIKSIKLINQSSEFSLEKGETGDWMVVTDSGRYRADKEMAENLVNAITGMEVERLLEEDGHKIGEYGFVDSKTEFSVNTETADYPFIIGDRSPVGTGTYIYDLGGGRIMIVADRYLEGFIDKSVGDYRNKKLFPLDREKIDGVTIKVGGFSIDLRKVNGKWVADDNVQGTQALDQAVVDGLLEAYSGLVASEFIDDRTTDPAAYGLNEPLGEIGFFSGDKGEIFLFGKRKSESEFYLKLGSDDPVYSISKSYFKVLPKNMEQLTGK